MNEKLQVIKMAVDQKFGRAALGLSKKSPEILLGLGVAGVAIGTVMACRATLHAEEVLDGFKKDVETVKEARELADEETYPQANYAQDLAVSYIKGGYNFAKLYGPSVAVLGLSIGSILTSHGILNRRNLAAMAAYKVVSDAFADYRGRVVEELGEAKDRGFRHGIVNKVITEEEEDENGKTKKVKKDINLIDPNAVSEYARFFDEMSPNWAKTPEYNLVFLRLQQSYLNDLLKIRGHVFLNEVYDRLGIPRTQAGQIVGWVYSKDETGEGDNFISFGLYDGLGNKHRDFVNGYNDAILLDFNVDGIIWNLI